MSTANFSEILAEREKREQLRKELLFEHGLPLVVLSLNLPGAEKRFPLADYAFSCGKKSIFSEFGKPDFFAERKTNAGCSAFFVYDKPAEMLKDSCNKIEDSPGGRIFDLDVFFAGGEKLSRSEKRRCFVCEKAAAECGRSRAHSAAEVSAAAKSLLRELAAERLSAAAEKALFEELYLTPKPGLVDKKNSGAHSDMCAADFEHAIGVFRPFFKKAALMGFRSEAPEALQALGISAESAMFAATGGINTHKGAIYLFLLLLYGAGFSLEHGGSPFDRAAVLAKKIPAAKGTHGEEIRKKYSCGGAREEAESGFPTAKNAALSLKGGKEPLAVLFEIMAACADTNILFRGGAEALAFMHEHAAKILEHGVLISEVEALDEEFIRRNLSPGGSADILALALFMSSEGEIFRIN